MILVIGAGEVGANIVSDLADTNDMTVVDADPDRIETLTSRHDVEGIVGDGRSAAVLRDANIDRADIVVASTDSDGANVMACNAAKQIGDPYTIARVKDVGLFRTWESLDGGLGVDSMLCIDVLAAETLTRTLSLPGAKAADTFENGQVEVAQFEVTDEAPIADRRIADADRYPSVTFAALLRDDAVVIPEGETTIQAGDDVVVIGSPHGVSQFAKAVSTQAALDTDDNIVIAGGGSLGYQIAQQFEARGWSPRIIEADSDRATRLSTVLQETSVAEADITHLDGFGSDFLTNVDLVVGALDDDTNYMLTRIAQQREIPRTAAVVSDSSVIELFENSGLDVVIHPKDIIAGEILQAVYGDKPEDIWIFEGDTAEVIEVTIDSESVLAGHALKDAATELPPGVTIGAVIRDGYLQTPRGNKIIETGDRVIAFVDAAVVEECLELL